MRFVCNSLVFVALLFPPVSHAVTLKTLKGKTIEDAEIVGKTADKVKWKNATGMGSVPIAELTPETLKALGIAHAVGSDPEATQKQKRATALTQFRAKAEDISLKDLRTIKSSDILDITDSYAKIRNESGVTRISLDLFPDSALEALGYSSKEVGAMKLAEEQRDWIVSSTRAEYSRRLAFKKLREEGPDSELRDLALLYDTILKFEQVPAFELPRPKPFLVSMDPEGAAIGEYREKGFGSIGCLSFSVEGEGFDLGYIEELAGLVGADVVLCANEVKTREEVVQMTETLYPGKKVFNTSTTATTVGEADTTATMAYVDADGELLGFADGVARTEYTQRTTVSERTVVQEAPTVKTTDAVVEVKTHHYSFIFLRKLRPDDPM